MAKSRNVANLIAANLLPASNTITTSMLADGAVTAAKLASSAVTLPKLDATVTASLPATITAIAVTNPSYTVQPDTALTSSGGYIRITGTGFISGAQVYINNTAASTTVFVSSTEIRAQIPALAVGYYHIYVQNPNGQAAIRVNGLYVSNAPVWITGSSIGSGNGVPFGIQLAATSDTSVLYSLAAGSSLPSGVSLTQLGYLSGTVSGLSTTTTYSIDIVATDSELQNTTRTFTLTISVAEPYFNQNALLLQGNYTNSVPNNNTFLDTSLVAAGITKTGNVAQGTFSPFSQTGWSNYFDGSGDYLSNIGTTTSFNFMHNTTALWTWEAWAYVLNPSVAQYFIDNTDGASAQTGLYIGIESSKLMVTINRGTPGTGVASGSSTTNVPAAQWVHLAITYDQSLSSDNGKFYINGVASGTLTKSGNAPSSGNASNAMRIGCFATGSGPFAGYISNLRITNSIVYTGAFTPSTAPLTAIANTSLLACNSNRFVDTSTNNFTMTRNGDVSVQAFSPFAPTGAYLSTTNGGSSYFDGSGDYLTINASSPMTIGTSSATVEFWMYPLAEDGIRRIVTSTSGSFTSGTFYIRYNNGTFVAGSGAGAGNSVSWNGYPQLNAWNHIAWVGTNGTSQALFVNGVQVGTAGSYNLTESIQFLGGFFTTGPAEFYRGYISDFRVMKGTALYTGTFALPTAPLLQTQTSRTNVAIATGSTTSSLMNFTNAGIFDATGKNTIESVGTATTQTTYFKYGGGALQLTGTGFLSMPTTPMLNFGTGPFTIEAWVYLTAAPANNLCYTILSNYTGTTNNARYWWLGITSGTAAGGFVTAGTGSITFATTVYGANNTSIYATPTWTYNQWNHIAVTRDASNNFYIFYNGQSLTTATNGANASWSNSTDFTTAFSAAPNTIVGAQPSNSSVASTYFIGYIDELRVTTGVARFTANFTPATSDLATQ